MGAIQCSFSLKLDITVPLEVLKLNKQLTTAMQDMGFTVPKEVQAKTLSRIIGGQDLVVIGPEGCGKSTALVLGILAKLKYAFEIAPRVMIMVPNKENGLALEELFKLLGKNTDIRVLGVYAGSGMEAQREMLEDGVDVVIGTPDRIEALYIKSAINLTQLKSFVLEDADLIVKQGLQTVVKNIAESLPKCQHLVFTEVVHDRLNKLTSFFLIYPTTIEISVDSLEVLNTTDLLLYQVPNYKTKLNLLNLLMRDYDTYKKAVVFVNSYTTGSKLYKSLSKRIEGAVAIYKPNQFDEKGFTSFEDYKNDEEVRVLIVSNENKEYLNLEDTSHILHFDLPLEKNTFVNRVEKKKIDELENTVAITFATDIELNMVRKIEIATGHKMQIQELPEGLIIEGDRNTDIEEGKPKVKKRTEDDFLPGAAFHAKKESNLKDYNYNYKDKRKMAGKKSKRRDS